MGVSLVQQHNRNFYNVLDFGADPTGATFSDAAITAAFSAASGASGSEVHFPDGLYIVSVEHDVPGNCTVSGNGYNSILRRATGSVNYLVNVLRITSKNNVRITNLQIDGQKADIITNYAATGGDGSHIYITCNGIYVTGTGTTPSTNITIDHCWIHDAFFGNICPNAVDGLLIESNYLYNGKDNQINGRPTPTGPTVCQHITVRGNIVTGVGSITTPNQFSGIQFIRGVYITISENVCYGFGNTSTDEGDGIGLEGCRHVTISSNVCTHNQEQGIKIDKTIEGNPAAWDAQDAYVPGDNVYYLGNNFLSIGYNRNQTPPATATSNTYWTYQAAGPYNQNSVDVTVFGNTCADNNAYATYTRYTTGFFAQYAEDVLVTDNTFYGNYYGVEQGPNLTSLTIKNNAIYNNQGAGIAFYNNSNAYGPFLVEGNYIARNGAKGMDAVVPFVFRNNICQANGDAGVAANITGTVVQANPFFLIANNTFIDNATEGVLINGSISASIPIDVRDNYAPPSTIQQYFLAENGSATRCVNNRVYTQKYGLWYFTSANSVWIDANSHQTTVLTGSYTVGTSDDIVLIAAAANATITLPAPNATHPSAQPGRTVTIVNKGSGSFTVTVATAGGAINAPTTIANQASQRYVSDGTNWYAA